jgi:hypothetical protein
VSAPPPAGISGPVARLASAVAGLGDREWAAELARVGELPAPGAGDPPTYERLALAGVDAVGALADAGRWEEAAAQAGRLTAYFRRRSRELHPVAGEAFDGLQAAARARDPEELGDFVDLLREIFAR